MEAMSESWQLLVDLGLPDGAARPQLQRRFESEAVRAAVFDVARSDRLTAAMFAPLLAWLRAWRRHWPDRFAEVFGETWRPLLADLEGRLDDENRYLKLRRIAIENLSGLL